MKNSKNSTGPRIDPCGTPDNMGKECENLSLILTLAERLVRNSEIHLNNLTFIPIFESLYSKNLIGTESKAFL